VRARSRDRRRDPDRADQRKDRKTAALRGDGGGAVLLGSEVAGARSDRA